MVTVKQLIIPTDGQYHQAYRASAGRKRTLTSENLFRLTLCSQHKYEKYSKHFCRLWQKGVSKREAFNILTLHLLLRKPKVAQSHEI